MTARRHTSDPSAGGGRRGDMTSSKMSMGLSVLVLEWLVLVKTGKYREGDEEKLLLDNGDLLAMISVR